MSVSELLIRQLGPKGDGIHLGTQGRIYVERTIPGDRVRARVQRDHEGISRADVVEILQPSPHRQQAPCVHYDRCGGCTLQHLKERFYRGWKTDLVREAFEKQGLRPRKWLETVFIGSSNRRRATFSTYRHRSRLVMGYYRRRSDEIVDVDACLIAHPELLALRDKIKPLLEPLLEERSSIDVFLQLVNDVGDMVITGPVGRTGKPDKFVRDALAKILHTTSVVRISWRDGASERTEVLLSKATVSATFGSLKVLLPPAAFLQPTVEGEQALVNAVMDSLPTKGKFADLFSGCGTFTGPLLDRGAVDAYESVPSAVNALAKAADQKPLKVFRRDLFRNPLRREELNRYDAVVFDPPRAGCREQAETMASAKTRTLVGVSCNPATLARDARLLCDGAYWLQSLQVVDQFLWSHHVEMVAVFTKKK